MSRRLWIGVPLAAATLLLAAACEDRTSPRAFSLPPGDAARGESVFVDMACNDCHSVVGKPELREGVWAAIDVPLGGPTARVRTYAELVTSIINPNHRVSEKFEAEPFTRDGESTMRPYNRVMTVDQLIDLVTFLEGQYTLVEYPKTIYQNYYYP